MNSMKIGDKVIYPNHGLGVIEDIQEKTSNGENLKIFHVRIINNKTLVLVTISMAQEMGIRKPMSEHSIKEIYHFIRSGSIDITMNWKGRYKEHQTLMKSGALQDMALVLKSLFCLSQIKALSFREKKMMEKAKELIVTEISEASCESSARVEQKLIGSLTRCFKDIRPRLEI